MYHERQHLMHCAMHALNNLFQEPWADRTLMERIALELYEREATLRSESGMRRMLVNPFKSAVPLVGDYDISVVIEALKMRECRVTLHVIFNPRDPSAFELALAQVDWDSPSVRGVIVNFVAQNLLWGTWVTHHFYAIVKGPEVLDDAAASLEDGPASSSGEEDEEEGGGSRGTRTIEDDGGVGGGLRREGGSDGQRANWFGRLALPNFCTGKRAPRRGSSWNANATGRGYESGRGEESKMAVGVAGGGSSGEGSALGGQVWYSLDSRIPKPQRFGGTSGLVAHLAWEVREHHGHVFVVEDGGEGADDGVEQR